MLLEQIESQTAGDPMSEAKWVRSSLRNLSKRLKQAGHGLSHTTVGRLLKKAGYALHVNSKKIRCWLSRANFEQVKVISEEKIVHSSLPVSELASAAASRPIRP